MDAGDLPIFETERALLRMHEILRTLEDGADASQELMSEYKECHSRAWPRLVFRPFANAFTQEHADIELLQKYSPILKEEEKERYKHPTGLGKIRTAVEVTLSSLHSAIPEFWRGRRDAPLDEALLKERVTAISPIIERKIGGDFRKLPKHLEDLYDKLRYEWYTTSPWSMPVVMLACETANDLQREFLNLEMRYPKGADDILVYDLDFYERVFAAHERLSEEALPSRPDGNLVSTSEWTGRSTIAGQAVAIRRYVPVALEALDEIIRLHELVADNRTLTDEEKHAIGALRRLHSDLGILLAAVEAGRPFDKLLKSVERAAQRCFSMAKETKEVLIGGTPAIGAAYITSLGAVGALELCGVDVNLTHATIAFGVSASVYGKIGSDRRKVEGLQ